MGNNNSTAALIEEAWRTIYVDERKAAALGRLAIERAQRAGDAESEAFGLFHVAHQLLRDKGPDAAAPVIEQAHARCAALGVERGLWLVEDLRGMLAVFRGHCSVAMSVARSNDRIPEDQRPPVERFVTLRLLFSAAYEGGRFDDALGSAYRLLAAAEAVGLDGHRAVANQCIGTLHGEASNVEEARPYYERSLALWRAAGGSSARVASATANVIRTYYALSLHDCAYEVLEAWLAQPGGASSTDLHCESDAVALAYLGVGRLDDAEQALALGPFMDEPGYKYHAQTEWTWVRGRVLCARGRYAEARDLCRAHLDGMPNRPIMEFPYDVYQLNDVVRIACEGLGDAAAAAEAARRAHAAAVPLVGSSARARYFSLQFDRAGRLQPASARAIDRRRLAAIDEGVRQYSDALEQQPEASAEPTKLERHKRFVAHVSHEMRGPIGGLLGMTSLLLTSNLDERQRKYVSLTKSSAETLLHLVNDILDLAKIESGRFELDPGPFSVAHTACEVTETFSALAESKCIGLAIAVDPSLPPTLLGDALRIRQVLTNLVSNAIKFTSSGAIQVNVKRRTGAQDDRCALRFEVRDTGRGISAEARQRLFTEFMQEDASTAREFGGTGLGLALCRQLVNLMDGEIGVESEPGVGSLFWFELLLPVAHEACSVVQ